MPRENLRNVVIGAVIALMVIAPFGAFAFIKSGIYDVAASRPHTKFTFWVTHETMIHSVRSHARHIDTPARAGAAQALRGFCAYETHCVACHGAAGVAREHWVGGMEPQPPYLLDATHQFKPRELFWIVKNGIKMTGMPSWRDSMSDDRIWEIVAFLEAMPQMDSDAYALWRKSGQCRSVSARPVRGPLSIPPP